MDVLEKFDLRRAFYNAALCNMIPATGSPATAQAGSPGRLTVEFWWYFSGSCQIWMVELPFCRNKYAQVYKCWNQFCACPPVLPEFLCCLKRCGPLLADLLFPVDFWFTPSQLTERVDVAQLMCDFFCCNQSSPRTISYPLNPLTGGPWSAGECAHDDSDG